MSISGSLASFNKAVDDFKREIPERVVKLQRAIVHDALRRIVMRTPVDTGRHKGNWQITIGIRATGEVEGAESRDPLKEVKAALAGLGPYEVVYITNNAPAIEVLEYGKFEPADPGPSKDKRKGREGRVLVKGGFSVQTPQGMVTVTLVELEAKYS